jgi:hypothetical protein
MYRMLHRNHSSYNCLGFSLAKTRAYSLSLSASTGTIRSSRRYDAFYLVLNIDKVHNRYIFPGAATENLIILHDFIAFVRFVL